MNVTDLHGPRGWSFFRGLAWLQLALGGSIVAAFTVFAAIHTGLMAPSFVLYVVVLLPAYLLTARLLDVFWSVLRRDMLRLEHDVIVLLTRGPFRRLTYLAAPIGAAAHAACLAELPNAAFYAVAGCGAAFLIYACGHLWLFAAALERRGGEVRYTMHALRRYHDDFRGRHGDATPEMERIARFTDIETSRLPSNPGLVVRGSYYPDLGSRPVHPPERFPWARAVIENLDAIEEEARQALAKDLYRQYCYPGVANAKWVSLQLYSIYNDDGWSEAARTVCPKTREVLSALPIVLPQEVMFSALLPGTKVPPHRDDGNLTLTVHFALAIPDGSGIKVAGRQVEWRRDQPLVFDAGYEHEVWNDSDDVRIVLLMDAYHPELTPPEVEFLQGRNNAEAV